GAQYASSTFRTRSRKRAHPPRAHCQQQHSRRGRARQPVPGNPGGHGRPLVGLCRAGGELTKSHSLVFISGHLARSRREGSRCEHSERTIPEAAACLLAHHAALNGGASMITLYDYLPSQNAYKVRLLLSHLRRPYRTKQVALFDGEGQKKEF